MHTRYIFSIPLPILVSLAIYIHVLSLLDDACVKLLILKLLYGIFTRPSLYEFFYTNDLYVLVDIMLREVCDLGEEREAEAVSVCMCVLHIGLLIYISHVAPRRLLASAPPIAHQYTTKTYTIQGN